VAEGSESNSEVLSQPASYLVGGNLIISGRRTSVRLELELWDALEDVAKTHGWTIHQLASSIHDKKKAHQSFTSAIRVYLLLYYRKSAAETVERIDRPAT